MIINRTITKKILETVVHETFSKFGNVSSSTLLDSLKFLGFYYATNAGISINIEDLKTPKDKKIYLEVANHEMSLVSEQWEKGFVSDTERFQTIIDSWNIATESLKNRIIDYYQTLDPANNLYIMAFSGARGNMSQVRQLVGMRGLMSDQEGKIIDLPIQTNFREGLSSIDYIISSYGARKGIVDTALKTADSGYLTRRLIYISQDLIIREIDCKTKQGVIVLLNKNTNTKNIVGRYLLSSFENNKTSNKIFSFFNNYSNSLLDNTVLVNLKKKSPLILNIRSPLNCLSNGSICQKCYGWDLAQNKIISLGEAVGIIAAQSIGEPGTQLTMRTFHTGGIFTSEMLKETKAPFSGKIELPSSLKTTIYRTNHGITVLKLQQETVISIKNWKGDKKDIFLEIGSFLYINPFSKDKFVKKGQLISEYSTKSVIPGARKLKPIYTTLEGEIKFESLSLRYIKRENKSKVRVNQDDGILWLASGKVFSFPKEMKYKFPKILKTKLPLGALKLISPIQGIVKFEKNQFYLFNNSNKIIINLSDLIKNIKNCRIEFVSLVKNYQYVDKNTTICLIYVFPIQNERIYAMRQQYNNPLLNDNLKTILLVTESDIWKINTDQINLFSLGHNKTKENINWSSSNNKISLDDKSNNIEKLYKTGKLIRAGNFLNSTTQFSKSGIFLQKDGLKFIFQNALPIFLSRGTILNYAQGSFVFKKQILATLVNYTQQTEDIVQGLPKIEEIIEARVPKLKCYLALMPGILLNLTTTENYKEYSSLKINKNIISYYYLNQIEREKISKSFKIFHEKKKTKSRKQLKQIIQIIHSIFERSDSVFYNEKLWKAIPLPPDYMPIHKESKAEKITKKKKKEYNFKNIVLSLNKETKEITWILNENKDVSLSLYIYKKEKLYLWKNILNDKEIYRNTKNEDLIVKTDENQFFLLELLNPIRDYKLPPTIKILYKEGNFIDIGEPITEGAIDPHELLAVLFKYHSLLDGLFNGTLRSLNKFQLLLVNSVQSIYQSQGVNISSKHIEIIVRQMTAKVVIKNSGDTPFLPGELVRLSLINNIYKALMEQNKELNYKTPEYEPLFVSTTNSSLSKDGFLSAAGFQETKRVLTKAAIEGTSDWLRGLKECVVIGRLIPAGSAFLNYKNNLDNIYLFKG